MRIKNIECSASSSLSLTLKTSSKSGLSMCLVARRVVEVTAKSKKTDFMLA